MMKNNRKTALITFLLAVTIITLCIFYLFACTSANNTKTITVAASSSPHAEILEQCREALKLKGYTLDIKVMNNDYVIPNIATEDGEVDANYFQHSPYLESFNINEDTHLVSVAKIHYEPYAIYAGKSDSINSIPQGGKIVIPDDPSNAARALLLLEANGIIKLKEGKGLSVTKNDITENKKNLNISLVEASLIPSMLDNVDAAVINGNYAIQHGLKIEDAIAIENAESDSVQTFANLLVVKEGNEENPAIMALVEVLQSDEIKEYINTAYKGAVIPIN